MLVKSNFYFSHSVFKRLVLQTCKSQGLFGKGLRRNSIYLIFLFLLHSGLNQCNTVKEVLLNVKRIVKNYFVSQDSNFSTALELAVRFGKTLIVEEVDDVEPVLYPLLRGDLISQGEQEKNNFSKKLSMSKIVKWQRETGNTPNFMMSLFW